MIDYAFTYSDLEYFLLVFVRVSCFFLTAPFFSTPNVPRNAKAGLAFVMSVLIYSAVLPHSTVTYDSLISFAIIVIKEATAGLIIGFGANICLSITQLAGKEADMEIGLSMVQMFDPLTKENSGFMGTIYEYSVILILLITNMHHFIIRAFVETYTLIPIGGAKFNSESIVSSVSTFLADYVAIAFRFCLPVVAAMMLLNVLLGVMAKTAPQMNMFAVGIQLKIIAGFLIIVLSIALIPTLSNLIFDEMDKMMQLMIKSLMGT